MENELTPTQYFEQVKEKKNKITDKQLLDIYDNCLHLLNKYKKTGQVKGMKKLIFHLETIEKEREIVQQGIDTFVYYEDIELYIDKIAKNTVKIIELENYEREIPDDVIAVYEKVKHLFSRFYVLFTDYTGKVEREVEKERRDKDPILFGAFQDQTSRTVIERFYYIGDWEDEFCDLTLDKMVNEVKAEKNKNIAITIKTPKDISKLKEQINALEERNGRFVLTNNKKKSFFQNVKTFLTKTS